MIRFCKGAPAMPFVRVPDATEGDIQKAVDLGALGIIVPMVDTVEKVKNALVMGYHALRRAFNTEVWDFRRTVFLGENPYRRRVHGNRDQWCPRFNAARRCWG